MITEESLAALRADVASRLSARRYEHTLGVERAAREIGEHCLPDKIIELSAAALLHDVAKELSRDEQLCLMRGGDVDFTDEDIASEPLYHAFAAPAVIRSDFPDFATEDILSSVFLHTSGGANMSLFDEIVFLADFVEEGREYDACKEIRRELFDALEQTENVKEKCKILHYTVLRVIDFTIYYLEKKNKNVNSRMLLARTAIGDKLISVL